MKHLMKHFMTSRTLMLLLAVTCFFACGQTQQEEPVVEQEVEPVAEEDRWEEAMLAFEESDRTNPPPKGAAVFLGSSSFRRWNLDQFFEGKQVVNRGFGGSHMADALRYVDRIVVPLEPSVVFVYEGDNDLASGKTLEIVVADYQALVARIHEALPATKIVFVCIKPSIRRWNLIESIRETNAAIKSITESDERLEYVDIDTPMLGTDGMPRPELFVEDNLHINDAGYTIWAELINQHLD